MVEKIKKANSKKASNSNLLKSGKITVYVYIIVICLIAGLAILSFVSSFDKANKYKEQAITNCISECKIALAKGKMLSNGPCLSESIAPGWVCDSVNDPRSYFVDDLEENQCASFVEGINHHFVEVSNTCEFVRTN
ncbi:MAG: hypothetical protein WCX82_04155 [archaeon]